LHNNIKITIHLRHTITRCPLHATPRHAISFPC